jgi:hypothetical protein
MSSRVGGVVSEVLRKSLCDRSRLLDAPTAEDSLILFDGGEEPEPRGGI